MISTQKELTVNENIFYLHSPIKTAVIYRIGDDLSKYYIIDGDWSHAHNVYGDGSCVKHPLPEEIYKDTAEALAKILSEKEPVYLEELRQAIVQGAYLIEAGWII
jgi:hypothetical protein